MKHSAVAIVPAAGLGKRFGPGTNKPFHLLLQRPLLVWTLEVLEEVEEIQEIIPVLKGSDMDQGIKVFEEYKLTKVRRIAPGGKERQDSVYNGLKLLKDDPLVLIHDGARPLVEREVIERALQGITGFDGVITGMPVKDTIKEVHEGIVRKTLQRDILWSIQTPQVFLHAAIMKAYHKAQEEKFYATDDAALVEKNGGRTKVVRGSYTNIKITTPEDIPVAEALLQQMIAEGKRRAPL